MKYPTSEKKPSNMFLDSLSGGGTSSIICSCGRMHYATNDSYDCDEEDDSQSMLDCALEEQKKDPDGVIINFKDDFVHTKEIDNKIFVVDCPCNGLRRYEEWMWNNRNTFREYFVKRVNQEAIWAEQEKVKNKLAGI